MLIKKLRSRDLVGRKKKKDEGFTLVELLVVITILGILAAVVIAAVSGIGDKGEESAKKTDLSIVATSQEARCAAENGGSFDDPLILQREGFQSSQSGYSDVIVDKTQGPCDGTSFKVWQPEKTTYPVSVTGCLGKSVQYPAKPAKPLIIGEDLRELFANLGIDGDAKVASSNPTFKFKIPKDLRETEAANRLKPTNLANPAFVYAATTPANYYLSQQSILDQTPAVDFFASSSIRQFTPTGQSIPSPSFVGGFSEDSLTAAALALTPSRTLKTYSAFSWGGCTSDVKLEDGSVAPRTALEGVFADIRNLGIIFDVQERAAEIIKELRAKLADSLLKAGAGAGSKVMFSAFQGAPGATARFGGNHAAAGIINLAGGVMPTSNVLIFAGRESSAPMDTLINGAPDVIVITGTQDATTGRIDCNAAFAAWSGNSVAAVTTLPAVANRRVVCTEEGAFYGASISSFHLVDEIATELGLGKAYVRTGALPLADPVYP